MTELRYCARCEAQIPAKRLEALPGTLVCVECSQEIGGDHELEVSISSTGKAGSLKKTGEEIQVRLKRKDFK